MCTAKTADGNVSFDVWLYLPDWDNLAVNVGLSVIAYICARGMQAMHCKYNQYIEN